MGVHVARVGVFNVDALGNILKKDDASITLKQQLSTSIEHLVVEDAANSNTSGNPTVKQYLELEAASNYIIAYMDQSTIITKLATGGGGGEADLSAITQDILPAVTDTYDIGSSDLQFAEIHSVTSTFDIVNFNDTGDPDLTARQLAWNNSEGALALGVSETYAMYLGEEMHYRIKNVTGSVLRSGTPVYATGLTPGGNNRIEVGPYTADGNVREIRFMGLMTEDCDNGDTGYTTHFGYIRKIDTRGDAPLNGTTNKLWAAGEPAWVEGDILYVHPTIAGKLTKVEPQHSISVAIVLHVHQNEGKLFVRPTTFGHLEDNHDVNISSPADNDLLIYDSASSTWMNEQLDIGVTSVAAGNGLDFTTITGSGSVTLGTPGSTTLSSTNAVTTTSHTHAFAPGGTTAQYIRGDGSLATFPTPNDGTLTLAVSGTGLSGSATFTADQAGNSTFTVTSNATSANTASAIVARDASGNFSAGAITATQVNVDNLRLDGNTLSSTNTNGNVIIAPNGTGGIAAGTSATVTGNYATVSGGRNNTASGITSTVSGGYCNIASGSDATISGGYNNVASGTYSTIGGGKTNLAGGACSVVGGGAVNCSTGNCSTVAGGLLNYANGNTSTVGGGTTNFSTATNSTISGGSTNTASAISSTIGGGANNIASACFATVNGGFVNTASAYQSTIAGGAYNVTNAPRATVGGGFGNTASGNYSTVGGGLLSTASAIYSTVVGGGFAKASKYGEMAHAAGRFAATGDAQHSILVARKNTVDATANVELFLDGVDDRLVIPAETTWVFSIKLSAYNDTDNTGAWWIFRGGIRRNAANGTALLGSIISERDYDATMSTTAAQITADDTNESLKIDVTGIAGKNIRWVAVIDLSQVSWGTP